MNDDNVQGGLFTKGVLREGDSSSRQNKGYSGDSKQGEAHRLSQSVVHCGKAIGVTMEESKGRWASLIEFAQGKEKQNQEGKKRKLKRKGVRELNSLCCSSNHEKAKD